MNICPPPPNYRLSGVPGFISGFSMLQTRTKRCIYEWKIDFKIDFYSSDSWLLKDKPLKIILLCFQNSFFRGTFSFQLISDSQMSNDSNVLLNNTILAIYGLWASRARLSPIIQSRNNIINNYDIKIASSPMSVQIRGGGHRGKLPLSKIEVG